MASTAPEHDEEYGEPATGLALVAVVEQAGFFVSDEAVSPLTKALYAGEMVGGAAP